ncbi:DNA-binding response regulator [Candidatus Sulfopaludibacter sp. SbA4]|nr:DNA-binding response regulator [Candidatus Sulfopaludibacter sp. SbA4]
MKILIVDDEPLARERIRTLLAAEPEVEIVGECSDGEAAIAAIRNSAPDVVFLDVQMPELDGFGVLERIDRSAMPIIVFVTAFDQYAVQAFEARALDYLLKPFDRERFSKSLARVRMEHMRCSTSGLSERLHSMLDEWKQRKQGPGRLVIRCGGRVCFVRFDELDWLEAAGNYVRMHAGKETYLHRTTMAQMEACLPPEKFVRVHRSSIVNLDRIKELQPLFRGDYAIILRNGQQLTLSKAYRDRLNI